MADAQLAGTCRALYCLSIARRVDLQRAEERLTTSRRTTFQHKSRVPEGGGMAPPLRMSWTAEAERVGRHWTSPDIEVALYEQGSLCITWNLPFDEPLEGLVELSTLLYDHAGLTARSRELARDLTAGLGIAADRPAVSSHVEDYVVFQAAPVEGGPDELLSRARQSIAQVLRAESQGLSNQEVDNALAHPVTYGRDDVCLVDWLAAFLMGADTEDERLVLELATIELLELRLLDENLEEQIEEAYELLARPRGPFSALMVQRRELEHVARMQADDALLHEGIDNALKLFGDDYLARLYRASSQRFHFEDWDVSIQRKLEVLRSVYQSLADSAAHRRSEVLEWIIILLIAVDIVLYFTPLR